MMRCVMRPAPEGRDQQPRGTEGLLLLEALVYLAVFFLIMVLGAAAFGRALDQSKRLRRNAEAISVALEAGERWRADIRAATAPPRLVEEGGVQALHIPTRAGEVVYFLVQDTVLRRPQQDAPWNKVISGLAASVFYRDVRGHVTAWRWELEFRSDPKRAQVRPWFAFQAVAGGAVNP